MPFLSLLDDHTRMLALNHPWASLVGFLVLVFYTCRRGPELSHIPTAGSDGILSYWVGFRSVLDIGPVLESGYRKFRGGAFKIALPTHWQVLVTSQDMIDELRLADDSDLSSSHAGAELLQSKYTVGDNTTENTYHLEALRAGLTRSLAVKHGDMYNEAIHAFEDLIPATEKDWLSVPLCPTALKIVCRITNRVFVGLPLCQNSEWIDLNINFSIDVFLRATIISVFPDFLKPLVGPFLSPTPQAIRIGKKHLEEEVRHRIDMDDEYGKDYEGRPNDMISWLLDYARGEERTVERIIQRLLAVNIAAIHTTANNLTLSILNLATYPEYILPLRQEVAEVVAQYGWTKAALSKMRKVDSFLKESSRFTGSNYMQMNRMVVNPKGYTFRNGLHLPSGTLVGVPSYSIHHDAETYESPQVFDGFRYSKRRDNDAEGTKHQMVSTSFDYLNFGLGRRACPGRYFAVDELKTVLAHLLLTYDVALAADTKPKFQSFGFNVVPDNQTKVLFRRLSNQ